MNSPAFLTERLQQREDAGALRRLTISDGIDFSSNDYLGFAKNESIHRRALQLEKLEPVKVNGSGASRLISGHTELFVGTEQMLAEFHDAETALIFNSGYDANVGFFACIATRNDTIIYDHLSHASIRDGIRLSMAKSFSFAHNDLEDLKLKLAQAQGNIFIAVESIYSMDGDAAPLEELTQICETLGAYLIVDEAHSNGIYGKGRGLVYELGLQEKVFARLHTFGKALGCHGAVWLGSQELKDYLINFCRSFIYTTALPSHSLSTIIAAYEELVKSPGLIEQLNQNIRYFRDQLISHPELAKKHLIPGNSPIQGWVVPGNRNVVELSNKLLLQGIDVRPIRYPTVPEGAERLRIIIHAFNTKAEIELLCRILLGS